MKEPTRVNNKDSPRGLLETMQYLGLSTEKIVDEDFAKLDLKQLHIRLPYKSPYFRTNLFSVTLILDGYGHYTSENASIAIKPYSLLFNNPGGLRQVEWHSIKQIHHYTFSEHFLLAYAGIHIYQSFPFLVFETTEPSTADRNIYEGLAAICLKIDDAYGSSSSYRKYILANLLTRLLLKIKEAFWPEYQNHAKNEKNSDILKNFIQNLEQHFEQLSTGKTSTPMRVKDYASKQNLHENYLSHIIKTKTGKTTKQWIDEKTYAVAMNMIQDSSLSIKQIAYRLGFLHISHFSAFFKKVTGESPEYYRKKSTL